jgi:beta-1,4-glucosyltransferase
MPGQQIVIGRYPVLSTSRERLAAHLLDVIDAHDKTALFFANTNFVVKCQFLQDYRSTMPIVIVNDGLGMDIASLLVDHHRFIDNLNGTDFTPFLFEQASRPLRVFLVGARPDVLSRAVAHVRDDLGQVVVGSTDGYRGVADTEELVARINAARPDVVLVAMGNPTQEKWIFENAPMLDSGVFIGVGALFDFWAGDKARAPEMVRSLRLEWLYRLSLEPRRLMRRYTLDMLVFLRACLATKQRGAVSQPWRA